MPNCMGTLHCRHLFTKREDLTHPPSKPLHLCSCYLFPCLRDQLPQGSLNLKRSCVAATFMWNLIPEPNPITRTLSTARNNQTKVAMPVWRWSKSNLPLPRGLCKVQVHAWKCRPTCHVCGSFWVLPPHTTASCLYTAVNKHQNTIIVDRNIGKLYKQNSSLWSIVKTCQNSGKRGKRSCLPANTPDTGHFWCLSLLEVLLCESDLSPQQPKQHIVEPNATEFNVGATD